MKLLQGMRFLRCKMRYNPASLNFMKSKSICMQSCLRGDFEDKPRWLKDFKLKQAQFQKDDDLPVFLKRGFRDKILYNLTLGMTVIGFFLAVHAIANVD